MNPNPDFVDDGRRYCRYRHDLALTQQELADELGVGTETITRRETGRVKIRPEAWMAMKYLSDRG